ncbi:hypothetical protein [Acholeplasma laidlawii]|uniref:hypothetical protein n=1 Tax=Acholeplasma laidlawii TaxID=2148 RepID=UPI0021F790C2|nr:hypothetical protein [Acholeplasma laidlawii]
MSRLQDLELRLNELIKKTDTSFEGINLLIDYYIKSLGWSKEQAVEYAIGLFEDGTIDFIKVINGKGGNDDATD